MITFQDSKPFHKNKFVKSIDSLTHFDYKFRNSSLRIFFVEGAMEQGNLLEQISENDFKDFTIELSEAFFRTAEEFSESLNWPIKKVRAIIDKNKAEGLIEERKITLGEQIYIIYLYTKKAIESGKEQIRIREKGIEHSFWIQRIKEFYHGKRFITYLDKFYPSRGEWVKVDLLLWKEDITVGIQVCIDGNVEEELHNLLEFEEFSKSIMVIKNEESLKRMKDLWQGSNISEDFRKKTQIVSLEKYLRTEGLIKGG